jgi:hypothetical protein
MGIEGIVSKGRDFPYRLRRRRLGQSECLSWREANKDRGELFNKSKRR